VTNKVPEKKVFVIDIDGTICTQDGANYDRAEPIQNIIDVANQLYSDGHEIIYFTARGSTTGIDWHDVTESQLKSWGVKYHKLILGKPYADYYIDDKASTPEQFLNWNKR
jgi:histidinol phosphatase-like enzyme